MRVRGGGAPPPWGGGGMTGGMRGGLPGGSTRLEWRTPGAGRQAAELASEAARAEGASHPATQSGRRADRSAILATSRRGVVGGLAATSDQGEQPGPLLRVQGDQQPHRRLPTPARQPRDGTLAVLAVGEAAGRGRGEVSVVLDLLAGGAAFALG